MADDYEVAEVLKKGAEVVIPPKAHRTSPGEDGTPYKARHLIEGMFHKPKHFHRVATRYNKTATAPGFRFYPCNSSPACTSTESGFFLCGKVKKKFLYV